MKRIIAYVLPVLLLFLSCEKTEFNSPALLGKKDGNRWKAIDGFHANIDEKGVLRITGTDGSERITLVAPSASLTTHDLKEEIIARALFSDASQTKYSTKYKPHPTVSLYPGDGSIQVTEYDVENRTISGLFNFNAYSTDGMKTLNFSAGNFYKIPVTDQKILDDSNTDGDGNGEDDCKKALEFVVVAYEKFYELNNDDDKGSEAYVQACKEYRSALETQKAACGDPKGTIQETINSLGDCSGKDDGGGDDKVDAFYADLDGKEFIEDAVIGRVETKKIDGVPVPVTALVIGGAIGEEKAIAITLPPTIEAGNTAADLGLLALGWSYFINKDYRNAAIAETVKLNVIEHDKVNKYIKVTFEFDAKDDKDGSKTYKITKGEIAVTYK